MIPNQSSFCNSFQLIVEDEHMIDDLTEDYLSAEYIENPSFSVMAYSFAISSKCHLKTYQNIFELVALLGRLPTNHLQAALQEKFSTVGLSKFVLETSL